VLSSRSRDVYEQPSGIVQLFAITAQRAAVRRSDNVNPPDGTTGKRGGEKLKTVSEPA